MLGKRPYPEPIEGLTEYLLRISYVNGYFKISELLSVINMEQPKISRFSKWSTGQLLSVNKALGLALNRDVEHVIELHNRNNDHDWLHKKGRALHELTTDFPRICTSCFKEEKLMDWRWSIGTVARCLKHKTPLLDTCPYCDKVLQWDANIFEFCPCCKAPWDVEINNRWSSIELSPLEKLLWPDITGKLSVSTEVINDICLAIYVMARPFDALLSPFHRVPYSKDHGVLVLKALQLLQNEQHRKLWFNKSKEKWHEYWDVVNPVILFNGLVNSTNNSSPYWGLSGFIERSRYIKLVRTQFTDEDENPIYHVNYKVLSNALNLSIEDIAALLDNHVFVHINKSLSSTKSMPNKKIFNLQSITAQIAPYTLKSIPQGCTPITTRNSKLSRNITKYGDLLSAVLNKEISGYFLSCTDLSTVFIDPNLFKKWLNKNLNKACLNEIPIDEVAKALSCSTTIIKRLVNARQLTWACYEKKGEFIDGSSFKRYLTGTEDSVQWLTIMD
jgi:hypothetical protein